MIVNYYPITKGQLSKWTKIYSRNPTKEDAVDQNVVLSFSLLFMFMLVYTRFLIFHVQNKKFLKWQKYFKSIPFYYVTENKQIWSCGKDFFYILNPQFSISLVKSRICDPNWHHFYSLTFKFHFDSPLLLWCYNRVASYFFASGFWKLIIGNIVLGVKLAWGGSSKVFATLLELNW